MTCKRGLVGASTKVDVICHSMQFAAWQVAGAAAGMEE